MRKFLVGFWFFCLLTSPLFGQKSSVSSRLDSLFQLLDSENQIIGEVCIYKAGKIYYRHSLQQGKPVVSDSPDLYRIGSISKTFTATLVMMAVEEGKLSLDDKLSKWYPNIKNAEQISLRMMLRHRSGIHNFTNDAAYGLILSTEQSKEDMLQRFASMEADFAPDEKMDYSNTNYVLISYILEEVYEKSIAQLLRLKISQPLELEYTYFFEADKKYSGEQDSYYWTGEWTGASRTHPSIPLGAGGICSNTAQLCVFMRALHQDQLINSSSLQQMLPIDQDGMGLFNYPFYERMAYGHNGGIDGFINHASYMPSEDLAIAVCLNGSQYPFNDLLVDILSIYFEREDYSFPVFEEVDMATEDLEQYVGLYKSKNFQLDIEIFVEDGQLKGRATGQNAFPLKAYGEHKFEFKAASIKMTFDPSTGALQFEQGGMKVPFNR